MNPNADFYVTGGTLPGNAISYVQRQADELLYTSLCRSEYCYILTSRQMGKSSLMVRTATRLREHGVRTAVIDLTSLGQNVTVEQWYKGILNRIGQGLGIEEVLDDFWYEHAALPPLERWLEALRQVVLSQNLRKVVLFIDEIDMVRSLAFKTDEFFAGIRACYNRREQDPDLSRLTFCLLGVASPSDLIQNSHITPFNIGKRIELYDFTLEEAAILAAGISVTGRDAADLMRRILHWTGGQPYLTQRLCAVVASDTTVMVSEEVDRLCSRLFFSRDAQQHEINLSFVRDRMLKSGQDIASLLDLYRRILTGHKHVEYDPVAPLCEILRLSGIVRVADGRMEVRNRIYARVFDSGWVRQNMPDVDRRRQAYAYRCGVLRALSVASILMTAMGIMLTLTFRSKQKASTALTAARQERDNANRHLYTTNMNLAQRAYEEGNVERAEQLLQDCGRPGLATYCGFEWRYLWKQLRQESFTLADRANSVLCTGFSLDGRLLVTVDRDGTIRQWSAETGIKLQSFVFRYEGVSAAAIARNAGTVAIATDKNLLQLRDPATGRLLRTLTGSTTVVSSIAFSPDGRMLAAGGLDGTLTLWRTADGGLVRTFAKHQTWMNSLAFSADGRALASTSRDGGAWIEEVASGRLSTRLKDNASRILTTAFASDGRSLATGDEEGNLVIWDTTQGTALRRLPAHPGSIQTLAYSPDGKKLVTAGADTILRFWDTASGEELSTLAGHKDQVRCIAFSPDGRKFATCSEDTTAKIWDIPSTQRHLLGSDRSLSLCAKIAPDGRTAVTANARNQIVLWDAATGHPLNGFHGEAPVLELSQDSHHMLRADQQGTITLNHLPNRTAQTLHLSEGAVWALAVSPAANEFAVAGKGSAIVCANLETGVPFRTIQTRFAAITSLAFSSDGRLLAIGDADGSVDALEYATAKIVFMLNRPDKKCCTFCFAPTNCELATGFTDGTVELRSIRNGRSVWSVPGQVGCVSAMAFSPDGINIATGSSNHTVHLWNVKTGTEVWTFKGHSAGLSGLKFTPDGCSLVSIDQGRTVIAWQAAAVSSIPAPAP